MKGKFILFMLLAVCLSAFALTACIHEHSFGDWSVYKQPTYTEKGEEIRYCSKCEEYEVREIDCLQYPYYITFNVNGVESVLGVVDTGEYEIDRPIVEGYDFVKWVDENGNTFAESGVINQSIEVTAQFVVAKTCDFETLKKRIDLGIEEICIGSDIEITETLYIFNNLSVYTDGEYAVKRAEGFLGDLFVVGQNSNGDNPILENRTVTLKLSTVEEEGKLTFDGNKEVVSQGVKGSAFYLTNSSTIDMYDGVTVKNFNKVANERILTDFGEIWDSAEDAGGSAFLIAYGTLNMYGGEICDNQSSLTETNATSFCGGAIYNKSTFNMYGGVISNNQASRGGAIYCYKTTNLYDGDVVGNYASSYGGAIYMPNSQATTLNLGKLDEESTLKIKENHSAKSGGAIFGQTLTNFVIYEGVEFDGNYNADGNGGAINTSGPVLANGVIFKNNVAEGKGGAIYITYKHPENKVRLSEFNNCQFIDNSAEYGGAVTLYSEESDYNQGAVATFTNCILSGNEVSKNGGALYVARSAELTVEDCQFTENIATNNEYGGGAIYFTASTGELTNVTFSKNTSNYNGGAIAIYSSSEVTINGITASENQVENCGGALYVNKSSLNIENGTFSKNLAKSTEYGGGAIYVTSATGEFSNVTFSENSAVYNGGAVALYSSSEVTINGVTASKNIATKYGGALYTNKSTLKLVGQNFLSENSANNGGGAYFTNSTVNAGTLTVTKNIANNSGGALYVYTNSVFEVDNLIATENKAIGSGNQYGGVMYVSDVANVKLYSITANNNTAEKGGAIYITTTGTTLSIYAGDLTGNTATEGNAIFSNAAKVVMQFKGGLTSTVINFNQSDIAGKGSITELTEE